MSEKEQEQSVKAGNDTVQEPWTYSGNQPADPGSGSAFMGQVLYTGEVTGAVIPSVLQNNFSSGTDIISAEASTVSPEEAMLYRSHLLTMVKELTRTGQRQELQNFDRNSRLSGLKENLLTAARFLSTWIHYQEFDKGELIGLDLKHLLKQLKEHAEKEFWHRADIESSSEYSDNWNILGNVNALRSLLRHLLKNAEQACNGDQRIRIQLSHVFAETYHSLYRRGHKGLYICLKIRDSGCGMSEETLAAAVQPLFSGWTSGNHSGLGLNISEKIMAMHGGHLDIFSRLGSGTHIYCFFPAAEATGFGGRDGAAQESDTGKIHILSANHRLNRYLHEELARQGITANYSGLTHEFIHLREEGAINPVILVVNPTIVNRSTVNQIDYLSKMNEQVPFVFMQSAQHTLSQALQGEFLNRKEIAYPFTVKELKKVLGTIKKGPPPKRKKPRNWTSGTIQSRTKGRRDQISNLIP